MATYIHFKNPNSPEIEKLLGTLEKTPGICIFIDIINSTNIKYTSDLKQWGRKLNNTFNFISFLNDFPDNIVKGIGDELMLFIPDEALKNKSTYSDYFGLIEEIYATIDNLKNFPVEDTFLNCKVGIHYCTEVYNITFFEGYNDYYGQDIDLTARLMMKAKANRIVLTETLYQKILSDYNKYHKGQESECLKSISGKYIEDFKGVPKYTEIRVIDV
ncbi:MAG: hypothetical protein K8S00_05220 [Bacteroidales bacterium]|nr:hypothetical protein [Bacteroidales bacterium]